MREDKCSKPATLADLKKVLKGLNDQGAKYLLIGGYALFAHGYHRATEDIDIMVPAGSESYGAIIKGLSVLEDQAAASLPLDWFDGEENIRLTDEIAIDIIFKSCGETYETLQPFVETIDLGGIPVKTLNLKGLLKTKQSDREKDKLDRFVLESVISELQNQDENDLSP